MFQNKQNYAPDLSYRSPRGAIMEVVTGLRDVVVQVATFRLQSAYDLPIICLYGVGAGGCLAVSTFFAVRREVRRLPRSDTTGKLSDEDQQFARALYLVAPLVIGATAAFAGILLGVLVVLTLRTYGLAS